MTKNSLEKVPRITISFILQLEKKVYPLFISSTKVPLMSVPVIPSSNSLKDGGMTSCSGRQLAPSIVQLQDEVFPGSKPDFSSSSNSRGQYRSYRQPFSYKLVNIYRLLSELLHGIVVVEGSYARSEFLCKCIIYPT